MKGHHHESCPRRALQQGELVVDTSCVLWDSVSESTRPLGQVKKAHAHGFLIYRNVTCSTGVATARCFCPV